MHSLAFVNRPRTDRHRLDCVVVVASVSETFHGELIRVIPPSEVDDHELEPAMAELAASRSILVCRRGGAPSLLELLWAFIRRDPIEPVTIVADIDSEIAEGVEISVRVDGTELAGVYEADGSITVDSA